MDFWLALLLDAASNGQCDLSVQKLRSTGNPSIARGPVETTRTERRNSSCPHVRGGGKESLLTATDRATGRGLEKTTRGRPLQTEGPV